MANIIDIDVFQHYTTQLFPYFCDFWTKRLKTAEKGQFLPRVVDTRIPFGEMINLCKILLFLTFSWIKTLNLVQLFRLPL